VRVAQIDEIIGFALEELLAGDDHRRRALVRRLCRRWPTAPALSIVFALTSVASRIEDTYDAGSETAALAGFAYRLASLLAADVYAVESIGQVPAQADDLLHFWRRVDPYFLDL